jgi:hypothetical protein
MSEKIEGVGEKGNIIDKYIIMFFGVTSRHNILVWDFPSFIFFCFLLKKKLYLYYISLYHAQFNLKFNELSKPTFDDN